MHLFIGVHLLYVEIDQDDNYRFFNTKIKTIDFG